MMRVWMGTLCRMHQGKTNFAWIGGKSMNYRQFSSTTDKQKNETKPIKTEPVIKVIEVEEELQPHWAAMESRVIFRKLKPKDSEYKGARGRRLPSAWDHENV